MRTINLEIPNCAICGGQNFATRYSNLRDHVWRKPGQFQIARCSDCGLVMTRPRPDAISLGFYYENAYSGNAQEGMSNFHKGGLMKLISKYRMHVMSKVRAFAPQHQLLDVGCSYGSFLTTVHEVHGCDGLGIDLDEGAIGHAQSNKSLEFKVGEIHTISQESQTYDWITFWESLEHHRQPVEALVRAKHLLKADGLCCVEVPNFAGFWRKVFGRFWLPLLMPQHLFHFDRESLAKLGKAAGLEICHYQTMFYPLEGVASLGLALGHYLKSPPPESPPSWRTPFDIALFLFLVALYFLVEIPSQLLLQLCGSTGHQLVIFKKAGAMDHHLDR